ncbi:(2Fe-2S)-binding protein [Phycicoccus sp. BSK3Z-2]|uniref:(2Fe-2S)-binding protein n=1 Tax=Phycicoccus avicenniae TaxID=2828860 RepID=A0A941D6C3_9MICO|nr:(2Fe-2S)-binding protein [Phycicoccus avicenniae]MBR7742690.1 (2Fe-2S)-binding protein [Phycicoccus avicenniae]
MSARHAWLTFTAGPALGHRPTDDPHDWQRALSALHARWYDGVAPPAVAAVFVLQWVLQVRAHTAAYAAATGPWRARLDGLTFVRGNALVPERVALSGLVADDGDLGARLDRAEEDYRAVAEPLAASYASPVRLGPRVRGGLVDDMWTAARRDAETVAGIVRPGVPARASCCLIYALPDCGECAGCPRLAGRRVPGGS